MSECQFCKMERPGHGARLPMGWKRVEDRPVCADCWRARFLIRAVTFAVAKPADNDWPGLREKLAKCWAESTSLANWAVVELAKNDTVRTPAMKKCPKMPAIYLYGLFNKQYASREAWHGSSSSACSVLQDVEAKYRKRRFEVVWTHGSSLPSYRYPVPFPVHNRLWSAEWSEDGRKVPLVTLSVGDRVTLQLRREAGWGRQLAAFDQIVSGEAVHCEAAIYRQAKGGSHRNGMSDREAGGGRKQSYDVMLKLVAWFPRKDAGEAVNTMLVRTDPAARWVAEVEGHSPWIMNADHVRRWCAEHRVRLQRTGEDTKADKRLPSRQRKRISELRQVWARKHDDRCNTFCHTAAKQLAEYAVRQKVAEVIYDDSTRTYLPDFRWAALTGCLQQKLGERGITLTAATHREEAA